MIIRFIYSKYCANPPSFHGMRYRYWFIMVLSNKASILIRLDQKLTQGWASKPFSLSRSFHEVLLNSTYSSFLLIVYLYTSFLTLSFSYIIPSFSFCQLSAFVPQVVRWWGGTANSQQAVIIFLSFHSPVGKALLSPLGCPATISWENITFAII